MLVHLGEPFRTREARELDSLAIEGLMELLQLRVAFAYLKLGSGLEQFEPAPQLISLALKIL